MERETKTIETPISKTQVVIYTYLTGREFEYAQTPLLQAMSVRPEGPNNSVKFGNVDVEKVQEATHRLIEKHVVSVNGKSENVVDAILDLHNDDYQFLVEAIQDLSKKN